MNWKSSLHEIFSMSFGQAFTIDEAYRVLMEQREDRMFSILSAHAESKRAQSKVISSKALLDGTVTSPSKSMRRRAESFLLETDARFLIARPCLEMAHVELSFIERCLNYIDERQLRIHDDFTVGAQLVQPYETAYELAWGMLLDPNPNTVRNYLCHQHSTAIRDAFSSVKQENLHDARKLLQESLASSFNLDKRHLTLTVNDAETLIAQEIKATLPNYASAFKDGFLGLENKIDEYSKPTRKGITDQTDG